MSRLAISKATEYALSFNGSNQSGQTASSLDLSSQTEITLTYWFKPPVAITSTTRSGFEFSDISNNQTNAFQCATSPSITSQTVRPFLFMRDAGGPSSVFGTKLNLARTNQWRFFMFTLSRTADHLINLQTYSDGILNTVNSQTGANNPAGGTFGNYPAYICHTQGAVGGSGSMKDIRMYTSVFTATDAMKIFANGPGISYSSPLHWWKIDEGSGDVLNDSGSVPIAFNLTNSPTWANDPVRPQRIIIS